ncbi:hypothetical protein [Lacrimispora xylanisolvens]|uniref:hypothetical protein n=1 Tax=Lacrimispora xylanisolvens TaxID=384636 RepID=UPI002402A644
MEKLKKVVNSLVMMTAIVILSSGISIEAQAASNGSGYLPKGWTSLGLGSSTESVNDQGESNTILRAPAPGLTSLQIIDLALDDKNEIHIVTREIGTSKAGTRFVWRNGSLCSENINEMQVLWGSDNIAYGYVRYFHTGIIYSSEVSGMTISVTAKFTNAMSPWNTLSASNTFVLP